VTLVYSVTGSSLYNWHILWSCYQHHRVPWYATLIYSVTGSSLYNGQSVGDEALH
jgi:hypothetical protein